MKIYKFFPKISHCDNNSILKSLVAAFSSVWLWMSSVVAHLVCAQTRKQTTKTHFWSMWGVFLADSAKPWFFLQSVSMLNQCNWNILNLFANWWIKSIIQSFNSNVSSSFSVLLPFLQYFVFAMKNIVVVFGMNPVVWIRMKMKEIIQIRREMGVRFHCLIKT